MSAIALFITLGIAASVFSSVIVLASAMLSSRIGRAENLPERFEPVAEKSSFMPRTYPLES